MLRRYATGFVFGSGAFGIGVSGIVGLTFPLIALTRGLPFEGEGVFKKPLVEYVGVLLAVCFDFRRPKRPMVVFLLGGVTGVNASQLQVVELEAIELRIPLSRSWVTEAFVIVVVEDARPKCDLVGQRVGFQRAGAMDAGVVREREEK